MMEKSTDAFRTISEVGEQLDLPQHVLRFWETRFTQIKPMKRNGGRRYYRPNDVDLLRGIRHLLYDQGYTIKGVQKLLKDNGVAFIVALGSGDVAAINVIAQKMQVEQPEQDMPYGDKLGEMPLNIRLEDENPTIGHLSNSHSNKDSKSLLQESLLELMECKRILDRARVK